MIIREGLLIKLPKFITCAVFEVPIKKLRIGICSNAPPPPLIVDNVKAPAPKKKSPRSNQIDISAKSCSIKNPALGGTKCTILY